MLNTRRLRAGAIATGLVVTLFVVTAGYEVQPGDTLASVAAEHGTTVAELVEANDIVNPDLIRIGQVLIIPGEDGAAGAYTVTAGDSLAVIAARHGTTVAALIAANHLVNPDLIRIGQTLAIPQPSETSPAEEQDPPTVHVVQAGESLAAIAKRYGTTAAAIAETNGITNPSLIYEGTSLAIGGEPPPELVATPASIAHHTVAPGDTLAEIALAYQTTVDELTVTNDLTDPDLIRIGDELSVPAGGWVCPVAGSRYFNDWGFPRSGGRFHQGTDLFAPRGTEVRAPVSGFVELKTGSVGGLQFWMQGDDGNLYVGTHLDAFGAADQVAAGEVIGYVGDSGNARGADPHVHLEIHVNGSPINPYPTLQAAGC